MPSPLRDSRSACCRLPTGPRCRTRSCPSRRTTRCRCLRMSDLATLLRYDAAHYADRVALRLDRREITFSQLASAVDEAAPALARHVAAGDRVALWFGNSFNWLVSFLAVNAIGAVSVPINTRLTPAEVEVILRDVRAHALIAVRQYRGRGYLDEALALRDALPEGIVVFDASDELPASQWPVLAAQRERAQGASRDDLLCIQYTSGTTA